MKRLQGLDWTNYKKNNKLSLISIFVSRNNNCKALVQDEKGGKVCHWLGDSEKERLLRSLWWKENQNNPLKVIRSEESRNEHLN